MRDRGVGSGKRLRFGAKILNFWGAVTGETTCKKTLKRSLALDFRAGAGSPEARRRAAIPGLDAPPAAAPPGRGGSRGSSRCAACSKVMGSHLPEPLAEYMQVPGHGKPTFREMVVPHGTVMRHRIYDDGLKQGKGMVGKNIEQMYHIGGAKTRGKPDIPGPHRES